MEQFEKTNNKARHKQYASTHFKSRIIRLLLSLIKKKNEYTADHCIRVMKLSVGYARYYGFPGADITTLKYAALLHDVGKILIPKNILNKQGKLNESEYHRIKKHPLTGYNLTKRIPFFSREAVVIKNHHERVDGHGYPRGLCCNEIGELSKIIAICDAFDAMTNTRVYQEKVTYSDAVKELKANAGTQFDSALVSKFYSYLHRRINMQSTPTISETLKSAERMIFLCQPDIKKIRSIKNEIENVRNKLNRLLSLNSDYYLEEDIIRVSQDLDKLICSYMDITLKD